MVTQESELCSVISSFEESTKSVFSTMLGWKLDLISSLQLPAFHPQHDLSGIISFSNALRGIAVVSLDKEVALSAAEVFIGSRPDSINDEVCDMVGELANMIGGNSRQRLGIVGISMSMPTVVAGRDMRVKFEPGAHIEFLSFSSPKGPLCVQWAIKKPE